MTPQEFCYWLQGLFELGKPEELTEEQVKIIQNHLNMVDVLAAPAPQLSSDRGRVVAQGVDSVIVKC